MTDREQMVGETGLGSSQSQPGYDASTGASVGSEPSAALLAVIAAFKVSPPSFATADKRGKFPMAAIQKSADGSFFDTVPLTHACTAASFDKIRSLIAALSDWEQTAGSRDLIAAAPDLLACARNSVEPYEGLTDEEVFEVYGDRAGELCRETRAAISKALGPSAQDISGEGR